MRKSTVLNPDAYHLRESAFRQYEPWFLRLVACYPEPLVITCDSPNAYTFSRAIRNAANSFLLHRWESALSYDSFVVAWNGTIVRETATQVIIAPRSTPVLEALGREAPAAPQTFLMELTNPSLVQLNAVAALYLTGTTMQPTKIIGEIPTGFVTPEGTGLYPQEDGSYLLL